MAIPKNYDYHDWCDEDTLLFGTFSEALLSLTGRHTVHATRITKLRACMSSIAKITNKPVHTHIKDVDSLRRAVKAIENAKDFSTESRRDYIKFLARLFHFSKTKDCSLANADREIKTIADYMPAANEKRIAKQVITREEIREMLKHAGTLDRAIILTLFESGMRIGEFLNMTRSDVKFVEEGAELSFQPTGPNPCKSGVRDVPIIVVEAAKFLAAWIGMHPLREAGAPLWVSEKTRQPLGTAGALKRIHRVVEKMNLRRKKEGIPAFVKSINPHNFRHSRATELGAEPGMTPQVLCKYFGWRNADMTSVYIHLSGDQVTKAILRTYGKTKPEEEKKIITHKTCQRCKEENPMSLYHCGRCGADLDSGKVVSVIAILESKIADLEKDNAAMKVKQEKFEAELAKRRLKEKL